MLVELSVLLLSIASLLQDWIQHDQQRQIDLLLCGCSAELGGYLPPPGATPVPAPSDPGWSQ